MPLSVELVTDETGNVPIYSREGRSLYRLVDDFPYHSDVADMLIVAKTGFVTDFASVPKIPFLYEQFGDCAVMPAVIHDYLYAKQAVARDVADAVLKEAMILTGEPKWKAQAFYLAVRMFGGSRYGNT